jgi:hypothetical protein
MNEILTHRAEFPAFGAHTAVIWRIPFVLIFFNATEPSAAPSSNDYFRIEVQSQRDCI